MARFTLDETKSLETSNSNQKTSFFTIPNDGGTKRVRFMYRDANDIEAVTVHEVQVNGKKRYVDCLRDYNSPVSDCPLCQANNFRKPKLFIPLYDVDNGNIMIWERGAKNYVSRLTSMCSRYPNLVSNTFEIERHGAKGSTDTTYDIFPVGAPDDTTLESLPEVPSVVGGFVLSKTAEEMREYLRSGDFSSSAPASNPVPQRRVPVTSHTDRF